MGKRTAEGGLTMAELEKVIKSFEECLKTPRCQDCPWESCERADCARAEMPYDLVYTGLAMLKAQEPKFVSDIAEVMIGCKPKVKVGHCPSCGVLMSETDRYCRKCGQAVKWK